MPPRYAYWTILIDNRPTAFRAREKEEMLPTFHQLRRTAPVFESGPGAMHGAWIFSRFACRSSGTAVVLKVFFCT